MPGGKPVIFHTIAALCEDGRNKTHMQVVTNIPGWGRTSLDGDEHPWMVTNIPGSSLRVPKINIQDIG